MRSASPWLKRAGLVCLSLWIGAAVVAVLSAHLHLGTATVVSSALLPGAPSLYLAWVGYRAALTETAQGLALPEVADRLAVAVDGQWQAEARHRRLDDPHPLPVCWRPADADLVEEPSPAVPTPGSWPGPHQDHSAVTPVSQTGGLAQVLAQVPTGRLIVLGEPGSGKTMLLVRLVLDMLADRAAGGRVPVLVPLASWNPAEQSLRTWLVGKLIVAYPALAEAAPSVTGTISRAQALLDGHLLLPILDGLDEIPEAVRGQAIDKINAALGTRDGLVVSSRVTDYRQVVNIPADTPTVKLRGAAGVVLGDLNTADVAAYLCRDAGSPLAADRWKPVLAALGTAAPVGQALRTPLMVSMARTIYHPRPGDHPGSLPDPAKLCDRTCFPERADVEAHLFDAFIPAAYRDDRVGDCRWMPEHAQQYLAFLARYLERTRNGATDLAWWELSRIGVTPAKSLRWSLAAVKARPPLVPAVGLFAGLFAGLLAGLMIGPLPGIGIGLAVSIAFCVAVGLEANPADLTVAVDPGSVLTRDRTTFLTFGLIVGPAVGLATGPLIRPSAPPVTGPGIGLTTGLVVGPLAWLMFSLVFRKPLIGLACGLVVGVVDWLVSWLLAALGTGPLTGSANWPLAQMASGLIVGLAAGLLFGFLMAAWGEFAITRCWLALRGRLPWRLMGFLADAHERDVLRQVGAAYQFRHVQLQRRLADQPRLAQPQARHGEAGA
jgi:NACHT domain